MRKFWRFLIEKEIPQTTGVIFLLVALVTTGAALFAPLSEPGVPLPSATFTWLFVAIPPISISLLVGMTMLIVAAIKARRLSWRSFRLRDFVDTLPP
jgi:hypothetical protein